MIELQGAVCAVSVTSGFLGVCEFRSYGFLPVDITVSGQSRGFNNNYTTPPPYSPSPTEYGPSPGDTVSGRRGGAEPIVLKHQ